MKGTWIPVLFAFLPDKKLDSYTTVFEELEVLLKDRGLSLSAQWAMADFEKNINKAVTRVFTKLVAKGCHFHFAQAIFKRVIRKGQKTAYSKPKNEKLTVFIRALIGMPYVPLERMDEAFANIKVLAHELPDRFYVCCYYYYYSKKVHNSNI